MLAGSQSPDWTTQLSDFSQESMQRVLVIEDEKKLLAGIQRGLAQAGYEAATAATHSSFPRPVVKVRPCPSSPASVDRMTYAAE